MSDDFYAQDGEDVLLAEIFSNQRMGYCLEVGALDGIKDSVTLHFEKRGWSCVLIEADPELAEKAKSSRKARVFSCAAGPRAGTIEFTVARGAPYLSTTRPTPFHLSRIAGDGATVEQIAVPMITVNQALTEAGIPRLDFASINVEGAELDVLLGFDLEVWKPRVLLIEDNDKEIRSYLQASGYRCFLHQGWNNWYARKDDHELLTRARIFKEWSRRCRHLIFSWTIGLLPDQAQHKIVNWKRRWLGSI